MNAVPLANLLAKLHVVIVSLFSAFDKVQNLVIFLFFSSQDETRVSVHKLTDGALNKKTKFPPFIFPGKTLKPVGLFFHQGSHFVYVYGNQVCKMEEM